VNPYAFLQEVVDKDSSVLSLCCGIGYELDQVQAQRVVGVDIAPQYINEFLARHPEAEGVVADALEYIKKAKDRSFDVISLFDAIEHLTKAAGLELLKECQRIVRKHIIVFTPEGYVRNEPHDAWGIAGADHWQQHLSGWTVDELRDLGFFIQHRQPGKTQHGEDYHSLMARWDRG
jgi:ubiquinone/menaquinone biosynthesis C-methylase UbiE